MGRQQTIQELMKAANITQKQLGERLGVDQSTVSKLLNRKSDPKLSTLLRLSKELGTSVEMVAAHYDLWNNYRGDSTEN